MIQPKSLQQRLTLFLILPVAFLLILMGIAGFIYARNLLLAQWREGSVLKLQRAAHQVDMRLARVKNWIRIFHQTPSIQETDELHDLVIEQLKRQEGVDQVQLMWNNNQATLTAPAGTRMSPMRHMTAGQPMMMRRYHSARFREITPPRFDDTINHATVSLISDLNDENGQSVGRLEVLLDFDMLIKNIRQSGWWQSNKAFLVNAGGKILTSTVSEKRDSLADSGDPLEQETVKAMQTNAYGTILGEEHPPKKVSGFYKLQEAPWYLVMIAPGNAILAPIVRFRFHYLATGAGFILLIVILIRVVTGRTVVSIRKVSDAAERVANGDYEGLLPVKTCDEVGELTRSFNAMVQQLKDRMEMKQAMNLAMEVQQNLLPKKMPIVIGLDIAARSIYCDETGGDLYDFLEIDDCNPNCIGIAVGDVSGHLKSRVTQPGSTADIISDVNRLVTHDTGETGQFMTLFYAEIDPRERTIHWVRAGHDPAMLYTPDTDTIEELMGKGTALGVDGGSRYQGQIIKGLSQGQVLLIGTDGLWETRNESGEMFGKERLKDLIRRYAHLSSKQMTTSIIDELQGFRKSVKQDDDITLVVIKVDPQLI
jgi:sigma-B regulation protein RsbU (phosphoserine phosphatase)